MRTILPEMRRKRHYHVYGSSMAGIQEEAAKVESILHGNMPDNLEEVGGKAAHKVEVDKGSGTLESNQDQIMTQEPSFKHNQETI